MGALDLITAGRSRRLMRALSLPITSPYSPAPNLPPFVITDILGEDAVRNLPLTREEAMSVPAVSKARNLLVSTIAKFPLRALRTNDDGTDTDVTRDHAWLYRTNSAVSPYERMAWTVDDLIFYGCSLWKRDLGVADKDGRRAILNAEWFPKSRWSIEELDGGYVVVMDGEPADHDAYILINSPFEGLLTVGQRTLRGARDVEDAWVGRARNPVPIIDLHRTEDSELDDTEVQALVDAWAAKRTSANGAIGSTPSSIELRALGEVRADLMVEGRNAIRTDVGSHLNIRASMLDGTMGIDSLTYTTSVGEKNSFYEFDLPLWTDPIPARLSLDDIVPRGTRVRFDMYEAFNLPLQHGARVED